MSCRCHLFCKKVKVSDHDQQITHIKLKWVRTWSNNKLCHSNGTDNTCHATGYCNFMGNLGNPGNSSPRASFCSRDRSNKKSRPLRLLFSKYPGICTACKGELNLVRKIEYINKEIYEVYLHREGLFARGLVCASRANLKTDYWIETLSYIDAHIIVKKHLSPPRFLKRSLLRKVLTVIVVATTTPHKSNQK